MLRPSTGSRHARRAIPPARRRATSRTVIPTAQARAPTPLISLGAVIHPRPELGGAELQERSVSQGTRDLRQIEKDVASWPPCDPLRTSDDHTFDRRVTREDHRLCPDHESLTEPV